MNEGYKAISPLDLAQD